MWDPGLSLIRLSGHSGGRARNKDTCARLKWVRPPDLSGGPFFCRTWVSGVGFLPALIAPDRRPHTFPATRPVERLRSGARSRLSPTFLSNADSPCRGARSVVGETAP